MDFSSFLTSLGTSFLIFVVLMLLFAWLSNKPGNAVIYYPNRILKGMDPLVASSLTRSPFAWIHEAMASTEEDVVAMSGVDSAVYFVFLSTVLGILVLAGVALLPVLLPIAATDDGVKKITTTSNGTFNNLDKLSMGNIRQSSSRLWAFLLGTFWISIVTYYFLWKAYKHVSGLRAAGLMSSKVKPEQFAALVRDLPPLSGGQTRKEQVDTFFKAIYPDTFYKSMIVTNNKEVNEIWNELIGYKKKLAHAEAVFTQSKTTQNPEGTRPRHKTGFLGLVGKTVDSMEYCNTMIDKLKPKLEQEQKTTLKDKQIPSALVFFTSRVAASTASQTLHAPMVDTWTVTDAPEPHQLLTKNLPIKFLSRQLRQFGVYAIVAVTIMFYMIPIGFVSAFTTLENLKKLLPFLKPVVDQAIVRTVLEAYLPQIALIVFLALLPKFLLFLSKMEGIPSKTQAVRGASGKYFYFSVLNVFIGVTIGGTLFSTFKEIEKNPNIIVKLLANSLPGNATFFITFVALQFFVGYGLELSRIVPLIVFHLKKKYLCKTEDELKNAWAPDDFGYATRVPADMLIITIVLCYSVIAPIVIPFGVIYFALGWLIHRNQALNVFVPEYESNGRMWPHMHTRILAALLLYQVTMFGYFGVKEFYYAPLLIPLLIVTILFGYICKKKFYHFFSTAALEVSCHALGEVPNIEHVYRLYIPPSLTPENFDEDHHDNV